MKKIKSIHERRTMSTKLLNRGGKEKARNTDTKQSCMMLMMNSFCGMVGLRTARTRTSRRDHCQEGR